MASSSLLTFLALAAVVGASGAGLGGPNPRKAHSPLKHRKLHNAVQKLPQNHTELAAAAPVQKAPMPAKMPAGHYAAMHFPTPTHAVQKLPQSQAKLAAEAEEAAAQEARLYALLPLEKVPQTQTKPAANVPAKQPDGRLPAMREATPAEHRASAHKAKMQKLRASRKQAGSVALFGGPTPRKGHSPLKHDKRHNAVKNKIQDHTKFAAAAENAAAPMQKAAPMPAKTPGGHYPAMHFPTPHNAVQKLPQNHTKRVAAAEKAAAPVREHDGHLPAKKPDGHLPAMHEATPTDHRASEHKNEMKKLRALRKQVGPASRNLLEHNKHNRAVVASNSTSKSANMCTAYTPGTPRRACCDCKFSGRQTSGYGDTPADAPYCCYSYMTGSTHTWATVGAPSTADSCYPTETCYDARF